MDSAELLDRKRSVVAVIDLQGKLMEMAYRRDLVVASTIRLMKLAEIFGIPVILTEQYPEGLGPTRADVREVFDSLTVPTRYVHKTSFGCCGDLGFMESFEDFLPRVPVEKRQVVVAGIEAHVCILQTAIELLRKGYQVHLCWECVSGRGEEYRRHALERMQQAGASITNHESVGFEWARDKNHEGFRDLNRLLREGQLT